MSMTINAASAYSGAIGALGKPQPGAFSDAAAEFARHMAQFDQVATGAMAGNVERHQLVQTIAEAELALETVVTIRDKVVEAYQEILRMPV